MFFSKKANKHYSSLFFLLTLTISVNAQLEFNQQKRISKGLDYSGHSVSFFGNGDYIIAGNIVDTVSLSKDQRIIPTTLPGIYLALFNAQDSLIWSREIKASSSSNTLRTNVPIKVGSDGDILIAGEFTGTLIFPNGTQKSAGVLSDIFWVRYAKNGVLRAVGTYADALCYQTALGSDLRVAIGGRTMNGGNNAFVALFDSSGTINTKGNYVFTGTKNNRDAVTSLCFGLDESIYFAGHANSDSIGYYTFPQYVDAPNDINRYTLFLGKFNPNHALSWFKGATPIPGSQPYTFDLNNSQFQNSLNRVVFSGFYNRSNFYLDKDTFPKTSTVNSDARKPIIICIDTAGKIVWNSSIGLNAENQRGEIYTLSTFENDLIISADIEHYLFSTLKIGNLDFNWGDKALAVIRLDSLGNIKTTLGTDPAKKQKIQYVKSCAFNPQKGYFMMLLNASSTDSILFPKLSVSTMGSFLISTLECNLTASIPPFQKQFCQNDLPYSVSGLPKGGRFLGLGIDTLGIIDPSQLNVGKYPFQYTINDLKGCESAIWDTFTISALSNISFGFIEKEFCPKDTLITLNASPSGGIFYGNGVISQSFNPSKANQGNNSISYVFTNANNCTSKDSIEIFIKDISECETQNNLTSYAPILWEVSPNPCSDILKIRIPEHITSTSVHILNYQGKEIQKINYVKDQDYIVLKDIPQGLIWVILDSGLERKSFLISHP